MKANFIHQEVADLAWALSSPPLVCSEDAGCVWLQSDWFDEVYQAALPWLLTLDKDPAALVYLLAQQKDHRLGKYFETLWLFWLQNQTRYELVESNLQVIIDGQTLGEMDFIVFDTKQGVFLHWELAVKFYLGLGDTRQQSNWHGPGKRDRLDKKVEHLAGRQCVISQRPEVKQWLQKKGLRIDINQVILKGRLYYRQGVETTAPVLIPKGGNVQHLRGAWVSVKDLVLLVDNITRFRPLVNQGWMANISTNSKSEIWSKQQLLWAIKNQEVRLPLHVELVNSLFYNSKLFIVGDSWTSFPS